MLDNEGGHTSGFDLYLLAEQIEVAEGDVAMAINVGLLLGNAEADLLRELLLVRALEDGRVDEDLDASKKISFGSPGEVCSEEETLVPAHLGCSEADRWDPEHFFSSAQSVDEDL